MKLHTLFLCSLLFIFHDTQAKLIAAPVLLKALLKTEPHQNQTPNETTKTENILPSEPHETPTDQTLPSEPNQLVTKITFKPIRVEKIPDMTLPPDFSRYGKDDLKNKKLSELQIMPKDQTTGTLEVDMEDDYDNKIITVNDTDTPLEIWEKIKKAQKNKGDGGPILYYGNWINEPDHRFAEYLFYALSGKHKEIARFY